MMRMHGKGSYRISIVLVFSCGPAKKKKDSKTLRVDAFFLLSKTEKKISVSINKRICVERA